MKYFEELIREYQIIKYEIIINEINGYVEFKLLNNKIPKHYQEIVYKYLSPYSPSYNKLLLYHFNGKLILLLDIINNATTNIKLMLLNANPIYDDNSDEEITPYVSFYNKLEFRVSYEYWIPANIYNPEEISVNVYYTNEIINKHIIKNDPESNKLVEILSHLTGSKLPLFATFISPTYISRRFTVVRTMINKLNPVGISYSFECLLLYITFIRSLRLV
ncbi:hypothetical protein BCR32DRAFT_298372 [Anaeromyces robustus]|uniref:Uncharacterized protein n=1 Tax=Anaeromyces robustus TaxID=1754192 RepID=A0A1Y1VRF1_9FUNG|nr:hypothetical protein BCR32DRAFT_298372 [Anaeromyces robustus]|eukprot:ORX63625.1 hypothetical protein BCR32DRAFT_298372 [Anaeromyces robustus]